MAKIPSYAIKAIENGRNRVSNMDSPTYTVGGIKKTWIVESRQEMPGNETEITVVDHKERTYILEMNAQGKVQYQSQKMDQDKLNAWFDELEKNIEF
jgi:hypothetical protein